MIKICGCKRAKSIPGLIHSVGLCQEHYNKFMFGNSQEHSEASQYKQAVYMTSQEWKQHKILNKIA